MEQSMAVKIGKGIVLIAGCSHPRMSQILGAASKFGEVYATIGTWFQHVSPFQRFRVNLPYTLRPT
jgi:metal-dependent hydrolase (beta-lactamase superfamily II)